MKVVGRLDSSWADHLLEAIRNAVRDGHHRICLDAEQIEYLSSAGIRTLLKAHRELNSVNGSFSLSAASSFVISTLTMSGFQSLLSLGEQTDYPGRTGESEDSGDGRKGENGVLEVHELQKGGCLEMERLGGWTPWQAVAPSHCGELSFEAELISLGIGAPEADYEEAKRRLGEFLGVAGCAAFLPGDGGDVPDYLLAEERFVPKLLVADALVARGQFSHLLRFQPGRNNASLGMARLVDGILGMTKADSAAFVILAEVDGLVGVSLSKSPGLIEPPGFDKAPPALGDWLSFCGERAHGGAQALIVGFVGPQSPALPPLPARPGLGLHAHAVVFPYRPLPKGRIPLAETVRQVFRGAEPLAFLHLLEDPRPSIGLGESSFVRGACWCAPLTSNLESKQ